MRILHIDIDTTRADHLGCYGYHRDTTPNIDRIAAGGVRFEHCYVSDAPCLPSRAALFMGRFGIHTGVVNHGGRGADPYPEGSSRGFLTDPRFAHWPAAMRELGMRTVTFSPYAERHSAWWFYAGFEEMHDTGKRGMEIADDIAPKALDWLAANGRADNWYLHVNLWDPHTPYRTPMEHGNPFAGDRPPVWMTDEIIARHRAGYGPNSASEVRNYWDLTESTFPREPKGMLSVADFKQWIDGYDTGIHYADMWVGRLMGRLEELGVADETAVLVSSDHGENQGELNVYGDHHTADSITSRVPCVLKWPGVSPGVEAGLHYQGDVAATIVQLLGGEAPAGWDWRGSADALGSGGRMGRDYLVISQCAWSCQRSVRWNKWLMIRTYDTGLKAFPSVMLFDVESDGHLENDMAAIEKDTVQRMQGMLDEWHGEMMSTADRGPDPMEQVLAEGGPYHTRSSLGMYVERLRKTGRGRHADFLERHGGRPIDLG